jgi:hypothetical protein
MKRAIEILPSPNDNYAPFDLEVRDPGVLRSVLTGYEPPSSIIPASMGKPPQAEMKPVAALVFEVCPDSETRKRSFVWLPAGKALDFPGVLLFCAMYVDETTGMPLILYEAVPE